MVNLLFSSPFFQVHNSSFQSRNVYSANSKFKSKRIKFKLEPIKAILLGFQFWRSDSRCTRTLASAQFISNSQKTTTTNSVLITLLQKKPKPQQKRQVSPPRSLVPFPGKGKWNFLITNFATGVITYEKGIESWGTFGMKFSNGNWVCLYSYLLHF